MSNLKVRKGQPITASKWNRVVERLPQDQQGFTIPLSGMSRVECLALNDSGTDRDLGDVLVIDSYNGPTGANFRDIPENADFTCDDPVWHTAIAKAVILAEPIPDGERGRVVLSGQCVVKLPDNPTKEFAMIDPDDVNTLKGADSGIARILADCGNDYCIVNLRDGSNLWRYKLNEASQQPSTTTAKLFILAGTDFSAGNTVEISDPDGMMADQTTNDVGWCIHVGNSFYAIQAPC